jgi:hypothetical protein
VQSNAIATLRALSGRWDQCSNPLYGLEENPDFVIKIKIKVANIFWQKGFQQGRMEQK